MEQRGDLARHSVERFGLVDMHDDARTEDRIDRVTETRARAGLEDDHAATRQNEPASAEKRALLAYAPISSFNSRISFPSAHQFARVLTTTSTRPEEQCGGKR